MGGGQRLAEQASTRLKRTLVSLWLKQRRRCKRPTRRSTREGLDIYRRYLLAAAAAAAEPDASAVVAAPPSAPVATVPAAANAPSTRSASACK